jgi:hypothetical protein
LAPLQADRLLSKAIDLPILFSHAYTDAIPVVSRLVSQLTRAKLIPFEGDHGAESLLEGDANRPRLRELVRTAMQLPTPCRGRCSLRLPTYLQGSGARMTKKFLEGQPTLTDYWLVWWHCTYMNYKSFSSIRRSGAFTVEESLLG